MCACRFDTLERFGNLADSTVGSNPRLDRPFLTFFGRPESSSACECERVSDANLAQALHLLNSDEIQGKLSRASGRADMFVNPKDTRPDADKVEEIFMWAFSRKPTPSDLKAALDHIEKHKTAKKTAYENILWALINTKEFVFVQ